jgi:hypothetical protein
MGRAQIAFYQASLKEAQLSYLLFLQFYIIFNSGLSQRPLMAQKSFTVLTFVN